MTGVAVPPFLSTALKDAIKKHFLFANE